MKPKDLLACVAVLVLMVGVYVGAPWLERLMQEPKEEEVGEEDIQFEKVVPIPLEGAGMSSWTVSGAGDESYNGVYEEAGTYNGYPYYQKGEGDNARYLFVAYREILNDIWGYIWALGPGLDGNLAYHPEHSPGSEPVPLPDNPWSATAGPAPAPTLSEGPSLLCTIQSPEDDAVVKGIVYVIVAVSGGTSPYSVSCTFGTQNLGTLTSPNYGDQYRFWVNTTTFSTGYYTITATAEDAEGEEATDTCQVLLAPACTAYKPEFTSYRADKRVNISRSCNYGLPDFVIRCRFSGFSHLSAAERERMNYKLFCDSTMIDSGSLAPPYWGGDAYVSFEANPETLGVGIHQLHTEIYYDDIMLDRSPDSRCEIVEPILALIDAGEGRCYIDQYGNIDWIQVPLTIAASGRLPINPLTGGIDWQAEWDKGPGKGYLYLNGKAAWWWEEGRGLVCHTDVMIQRDYRYRASYPPPFVSDSEEGERTDSSKATFSWGWPCDSFYFLDFSHYDVPEEAWSEPDEYGVSYALVDMVWELYADDDETLVDTLPCQVRFIRSDYPPSVPPDPPQTDLYCSILQPGTDAHLTGNSVYVEVTAGGGSPPYNVSCQFGPVGLVTLTVPNYGDGLWRFGPIDTTLLDDGAYYISAQAEDTQGHSASDSRRVYITNGPEPPPEAQDNPPFVRFLSPASYTQVAGSVAVTLQALDDRGLALLRLYCDGALMQERALSGTDVTLTLQLDTRDWANGPHNITAWVWDTGGNTAYSGLGLSFANALADTAKVLFTTPLALPRSPVLGMLAAHLDDPPEDPRYRYNVYGGYVINSDSGDFSDYTLVPLNRSHAIPANATTIKWGLQAVPQIQIGHWDLTAETVVGLYYDADSIYAVVWPPAVYKLQGAAWTKVVEEVRVGDETFLSCALADHKVFLATTERLLVMDLDAGDVSLLLGMPVQVTALAAEESGSVLCWGENALYEFTWPSPRLIGAAVYDVTTIVPAATNTYMLGTNDGLVVSGRPGTWVEMPLPGAGPIHWIGQMGTTWYAAGSGGVWRYADPSWIREYDTTIALRALTAALGYGWAVGEGETFWRRGTMAWTGSYTLEGMVQGNCLLEHNGVIYIGGQHATPTARIWAYRVDEGGTPSGPEPPDIIGKILREVGES